MKAINFILVLLFATSCMESNRSRLYSNDPVEIDSFGTIQSSDYESEIKLLIEVNDGVFEIPYGSSDTDYDDNFSCDLEIESRTMMRYEISGNKLLLSNNEGNFLFERKSSESDQELNGIWYRRYTEGKASVGLYLEFSNDRLRITKKCTIY